MCAGGGGELAGGGSDAAADAAALAGLWTDFDTRNYAVAPDLDHPIPLAAPRPPMPPPTAEKRDRGLEELKQAFPLSDAQVSEFTLRRCVRLEDALPTCILEEVGARLNALAARATGGRNVSVPAEPPLATDSNAAQWAAIAEPATRSWHIQVS